MMLRDIATTLYRMPYRAWQYGQRCPHEAIVYGLALTAIAMVSKLFIAVIALVVVISGIQSALKI